MPNPQATQFSECATAAQVLDRLVAGLSHILEDNLVGIYLYGSLVTGDFDARVSDLDLVVILNLSLDEARFQALHAMHRNVVLSHPEWDDRLELAYVSRDALRTFRERRSRIAIISPGEPFHQIEAGADWLISWYMLRETGLALKGPDIASLIEPMESTAYIDAVQKHIEIYREAPESATSKSYLSYIILTTARGLYTVLHGQPTSKVKAADWAVKTFPQWAPLIQLALTWRVDPTGEKPAIEEIRSRARAFVTDMLARLPCN